MKCLLLCLAVLVLIKTCLGGIQAPKRLKLTSIPRSIHSKSTPDGSPGIKSRVDYAREPDSHGGQGKFLDRPSAPQPERARGYRLDSYQEDEPIYGARRTNDSQDYGEVKKSEELSDSSYPSYRTPSFYEPSGASPEDSDSSYIPHSKSFSKYFDSKPGFRFNFDKPLYLGPTEESGDAPKYRFRKTNKDGEKAGQYKPLHLDGEAGKKHHGPDFKFESNLPEKGGYYYDDETKKELGFDVGQIQKDVIRNYGPSYVPDIAGKKPADGQLAGGRQSGHPASPFGPKIPIHLPIHEPELSHIPKRFHPKHAEQDLHDKTTDAGLYPEIARDKKTNHLFRSHYPAVQKQEQYRPFRYFQPDLKFDYDHVLKPRARFYEDLKKDLDLKMRLLKEHEEKTAELQKQHLEKYRAFFKP